MARKAAVIIGVGKTGGLAPLDSPVPGAKQIAGWLKGEGFEVECLTDDTGPVTAADIKKALKKFVTLPARFHLLVVYFSGHGYWHERSDRWLLSEAFTDTDEAINLRGAMDLASNSGIPNVVFISDACRSLPDTKTGAYVKGTDAFPIYEEITANSKVDSFKSTSVARSAYEGAIDGVKQSILTYALRAAFEEPEAQMVREVLDGATKVQVVPNRRLEEFLQRKINAVLAGIDPNLTQRIEVNIPSSDDIYISRVQRQQSAKKRTMPEVPTPDKKITPPCDPFWMPLGAPRSNERPGSPLAWDQKYIHDLWRPVTGLREHDPSMGPAAPAAPIGGLTQKDVGFQRGAGCFPRLDRSKLFNWTP